MPNYLLRNYFQLGLSMIMLSRAHFNAAGQPVASSLPLSLSQLLPSESAAVLAFHHHLQTSPSGRLSLSLSLPSHLRARFSAILKLSLFCPRSETANLVRGCVKTPSITSDLGMRGRPPDLLTPCSPCRSGSLRSLSLTLTLSETAAAAAVGRFVSSFLKWAARLGDFIFLSNSL